MNSVELFWRVEARARATACGGDNDVICGQNVIHGFSFTCEVAMTQEGIAFACVAPYTAFHVNDQIKNG